MEDVSAIVIVFTDFWGQDGYEMDVLAIAVLFTYLCGKGLYRKVMDASARLNAFTHFCA